MFLILLPRLLKFTTQTNLSYLTTISKSQNHFKTLFRLLSRTCYFQWFAVFVIVASQPRRNFWSHRDFHWMCAKPASRTCWAAVSSCFKHSFCEHITAKAVCAVRELVKITTLHTHRDTRKHTHTLTHAHTHARTHIQTCMQACMNTQKSNTPLVADL